MEHSAETLSACLDEASETWYIRLGSRQRLSLERATLTGLVSLYNRIHRGDPLTLIERRTLHELGRERNSLHETVRHLYDFIDSPPEGGCGPLPPEDPRPDPGPESALPRRPWAHLAARLAARFGL